MNGCTFLNNYSKSFMYMNPPATIIQLYNYFIVLTARHFLTDGHVIDNVSCEEN